MYLLLQFFTRRAAPEKHQRFRKKLDDGTFSGVSLILGGIGRIPEHLYCHVYDIQAEEANNAGERGYGLLEPLGERIKELTGIDDVRVIAMSGLLIPYWTIPKPVPESLAA